ncbi:BZ3500_MvSof-1268-A1-R1_Chr2-2g04826 [Microbotryum saponariae]|uniref:BZ3500_MvSof-1268-A1-R1_Chr2-2g04826 protein n=1 Tax=Microbotryum saponariae TaxID=289078 RepID=A0A2X0L155_9BASI|nr:BZ3500_MvSof-1268-A1-R1_Chr2-2g04826 [Microbotryum saponariae]SDA00261.1 BZ3501_MvSof-1269-A2-R1_Chr2-2g04500 [Microbotryum saponariae]
MLHLTTRTARSSLASLTLYPSSTVRPLSYLTSQTHARGCGCARCAPRTISQPTLIRPRSTPTPLTQPTPSTSRALSSIASAALHPKGCGCARCAPRSSSSSTLVSPIVRPGATTATSAGLGSDMQKRGMKVRSSVKRFWSVLISITTSPALRRGTPPERTLH